MTEEGAGAGSIVVLGSANMDLVVEYDRRPEPGETVFGSAFSLAPGGKGLNQAVAAARAGSAVAFLGAVGDDGFGRSLRSELNAAGIDTAGLRIGSEATGVAQISVTGDGENSIVVVSGANASSAVSDSDRAAIRGARFLVAQCERPLELLLEAWDKARRHGVTTVLTPAPVIAGVDELLDLTGILVPNEHEALLLTGAASAEEAAAQLSTRAETVVVTLGSRGALLARGGRVVERFASRRVDAIDTTAAGDTFVGYLVSWLATGATIEDAIRAAIVAASVTVSTRGAARSIPERTEVVRLLTPSGL